MYLTRHHTWPNKMKGGEEIWITVDSNWDRSVGSVDGSRSAAEPIGDRGFP